MIKLKDIIKESKWSDRKWGEPLPTLEDVMREASQDDDDAYVHVGGGTYKEKNRGTGEPLPNSPSYIKKDSGGFEMVDDDDPRLSKGDDDEDDTPKKPAPDSRSDKGKDRVHVNPFDDRFGSKDADDEEEPSGGDLDYSRDSGEPEDKPHGGDTGKDADYGGGDFTKSADYDMWSDEDPEDAGEPDFYDPEDYEKLYPDKTKPKDEVGDIKYGKGFSPDSDHMFDSVAGSASSASDKYSELLDSVKSGNWKQFRSRIHDIYDEDAREHLLNLANHVDSGTYNDEFPKGKKGLEFGRKEVMDLFRQAADYGDEQFPVDPDDIDDLPGGSEPEDKEESITINGKKYKPITESIEPTIFDPHKEAKKQLGGLYRRMIGK
jgi:hypothetical protein